MSERTKTISLHYKRKRADSVCNALNAAMDEARRNGVVMTDWLDAYDLPAWTRTIEVRRARTRFHYKVVAVS